jgi:hypothetical protein
MMPSYNNTPSGPHVPSLQQHMQDLVSRENYPLLGAVEAVSAALESSAVLVRTRFPDVHLTDPQFRDLTLRVCDRVLDVLAQMGPADDGDDGMDFDGEPETGERVLDGTRDR